MIVDGVEGVPEPVRPIVDTAPADNSLPPLPSPDELTDWLKQE